MKNTSETKKRADTVALYYVKFHIDMMKLGLFVPPHLSQVKLEHVAYVMWEEVRKLH